MTVTNPNWIRVDSSAFESPEEPPVLLLLPSRASLFVLGHIYLPMRPSESVDKTAIRLGANLYLNVAKIN